MTTITSSVQRVGSSSRPVAHSSDVDFDKVPSPRESPALSHRRSLAQRRNSGPSHLSQSTVAQDDDDDEGNEPAAFNDDFNPAADMNKAEPVEDFFVGDQAVNDDYVHDDPPSPSVGGSEGGMADEARESGAGGGAFVPFDPRRAPNERDLVMAMTDNGEGGMMYDYFDRSVLKNWAGPEHCKLRKVVRRRMSRLFFVIIGEL